MRPDEETIGIFKKAFGDNVYDVIDDFEKSVSVPAPLTEQPYVNFLFGVFVQGIANCALDPGSAFNTKYKFRNVGGESR